MKILSTFLRRGNPLAALRWLHLFLSVLAVVARRYPSILLAFLICFLIFVFLLGRSCLTSFLFWDDADEIPFFYSTCVYPLTYHKPPFHFNSTLGGTHAHVSSSSLGLFFLRPFSSCHRSRFRFRFRRLSLVQEPLQHCFAASTHLHHHQQHHREDSNTSKPSLSPHNPSRFAIRK